MMHFGWVVLLVSQTGSPVDKSDISTDEPIAAPLSKVQASSLSARYIFSMSDQSGKNSNFIFVI